MSRYSENDWEYKVGMFVWPLFLGGWLIETLKAKIQGEACPIENFEMVLLSISALDTTQTNKRPCEDAIEDAHDNVTVVRGVIESDKNRDELHERKPESFPGSFATQKRELIATLPPHLREIVYKEIYAPQGICKDEVLS